MRVRQSSSPIRDPFALHPAGLEIAQVRYGLVENLPDPINGTYFIVSNFVAAARPDRKDLVYPDSGPDCYRENGQIVYVRRFLSL